MATFNGPGIRVLKQYQGQDGKTYVQLSTGETLDTDSEEYRDYFSQGILYGEDERGNFYPQEGAHDILKQYQQLTQTNSFENYMKPYFNDPITGSIAKGLGQNMDKFWDVNPSYKQKYDEDMRQQFVNQFLSQNPAYTEDGNTEARGAYLDRLTMGLPDGLGEYILQSGNPGVQPSYWQDFNRGAYTFGNEILPEWLGGGDPGLINSIRNDTSLTTGERNSKEHQIEIGQYGFADRSMDQLGLFSPLAVPAKVVQSAYRPDYTLGDALSGTKNDAGLAEDIVTDPLSYVGLGLGETALKNVPGLARMRADNLLKLALEEPKNLIPGRIARTEEALKEANDWSRNWYTNPEFKNRADKLQGEFNNAFDTFIEGKDGTANQVNNAINEKRRLQIFFNNLRDNAANVNSNVQFQSNRNKIERLLNGDEHLHNGNAGVTYGEYSHPDKNLPMTSNGNQAFVNRALSLDNITSTGVHEGNHIMVTPRMKVMAGSKNLNNFFQQPFREAIDAGLLNSYYSDPLEIYARVQEFRKFNNIEPGQIVNTEEVAQMKKAAESSSTINKPFFRFNNKDMATLLNKLPAAGAGVGLPAWLLSQQEENPQ